jgi:enoyl-CoA hydratase/carnithine racemase
LLNSFAKGEKQMSFEQITVEVKEQIATVKLNRPEKLNAWTPIMGKEPADAFRAADRDPEVRAIVFTGAGERAFCAGADMDFFAKQIAAGGGMERKAGSGGPARAEEFPSLMRNLSKPTIAAINGYALGVGATMTLLCDVRVAVQEAKLGFVFGRMGVMAELGSTFLLPRIVGMARASELMLTGKVFSAAECERLGIVNYVVPSADLFPTVLGLAEEMKRCAPLSLRLTRQALYQGLESTFEAQLRFEAYALDSLYRTSDHAEAVQAFRDKRPPNFQGT